MVEMVPTALLVKEGLQELKELQVKMVGQDVMAGTVLTAGMAVRDLKEFKVSKEVSF